MTCRTVTASRPVWSWRVPGFEQNESDGWKVLENDQMIVASNRTGEYHVRSI